MVAKHILTCLLLSALSGCNQQLAYHRLTAAIKQPQSTIKLSRQVSTNRSKH
jgi:hypothetical protein